MAENSWRYGGPNQPETGISQVLAGYAARGGQLFGARRWPDNPLALTHIRWIGPDNFTIQAARQLNDEETVLAEEREVWVQLALHCSIPTAPALRPEDAPWLAITVEPQRVAAWLQVLQRARASHFSNPRGPGIERGARGGYRNPINRHEAVYAPPDLMPTSPLNITGRPLHSSTTPSAPTHPPARDIPSMPEPTDTPSLAGGDVNGWTGSWQSPRHPEGTEVIVLPCVEVEMPMFVGDPASMESIRDFTRDVAIHFARACKAIPQVRETRGWMLGNRMVLAARMIVASGGRTPTRAEMEGAALILADALARQTLPYSRLGFADAGAWAQGTILPE